MHLILILLIMAIYSSNNTYPINTNNTIKLNFIISKWSHCIDNKVKRHILIIDNLNNTYSYNVDQLNKAGILLSELNCESINRNFWKTKNGGFAIIMTIIVVIGMCCWFASYMNMSKQKIRSESIVSTTVNNINNSKNKISQRSSYPNDKNML